MNECVMGDRRREHQKEWEKLFWNTNLALKIAILELNSQSVCYNSKQAKGFLHFGTGTRVLI